MGNDGSSSSHESKSSSSSSHESKSSSSSNHESKSSSTSNHESKSNSTSNHESKSSSISDKISDSSTVVSGVNSGYQAKINEAKESKASVVNKSAECRESLKSQYREGKITLSQERSGIMKANNDVMKATKEFNNVSKFSRASKTLTKVGTGADVILSGYNSYKIEKDNNLSRQEKNIKHCENGGKFVGGFYGMKAGCAIGSSFGPVGTFVGGVSGAIICSKGGGKVTRAIGQKVFNEQNKDKSN